MRRVFLRGGFAIIAAIALAACEQNPPSTLAGKANEQGTIIASSQTAGGAVLIDRIGMPSTGWVVIHEVVNGEPVVTGSIGHKFLLAGPHEQVSVPLSRQVQPGESVAAMLHLDTGVVRVFEFANGSVEAHDLPILIEGVPVMTMVPMT